MKVKLKYGIWISEDKKLYPQNTLVMKIKCKDSLYHHFRKVDISEKSEYILIRFPDEREMIVHKTELI